MESEVVKILLFREFFDSFEMTMLTDLNNFIICACHTYKIAIVNFIGARITGLQLFCP